MDSDSFTQLVLGIVHEAEKLKDSRTGEEHAPVNYACVFAQSDEEFEDAMAAAKNMGRIVKETPTGPLFLIPSLNTLAGPLRLIKIRKPDPSRPERGDADFTVSDFGAFKKKHVGTEGFSLIVRENMELVELKDSQSNVRAYFSRPALIELLGIR